MAYPDKLWQETPLVRSIHISSILGCDAYLKLENLHPSQSFKYRGISHFAQNALRTHGTDTHLIIASSGNAGLAAACAANVLKLRCTVFLPHGVGQSAIDFMRKLGAEVGVGGNGYPEANNITECNDPFIRSSSLVGGACEHGSRDPGPASRRRQAPCYFLQRGGGGLAGGVIEGCKAVGWDDVPLVTMETHGSSCFYQSLSLNEGLFSGAVLSRPPREGTSAEYCEEHNVALARLAKLNSRATSLGATSPSGAVVKNALDRRGRVKSTCIPDELAMQTILSFAEDHKILVELACAATLSPAYNPVLFQKVAPRTDERTTVIFIICGVKVSMTEVEEYRGIVASLVAAGRGWEVACNGENFTVPILTEER